MSLLNYECSHYRVDSGVPLLIVPPHERRTALGTGGDIRSDRFKGLNSYDRVVFFMAAIHPRQADLPHRLALASMTRNRADADGTPGALVAEYYAQRASLGLLITEGTQPSDDGQGYLATPGIYTPEHIKRWRDVADAVHAGGGHLFIQLMHVGRISHPDNTPHHRQPVAPSPIAAEQDMFTPTGVQKTPVPRELTRDNINTVIGEFRHAAAPAIAAGADGVEIHAANGYLLHQFLSPNANHRTDEYGGSVENRSRFVVEVATAVAEEIGGRSHRNPYLARLPPRWARRGRHHRGARPIPAPRRRTRGLEPRLPARPPPR